jgi:hypothetical protein
VINIFAIVLYNKANLPLLGLKITFLMISCRIICLLW